MRLNSSNGILWRKSGLRLELARGTIRNADNPANPFHTLYVGDLNPQQEIITGLTKTEAIRVGMWFIARAFFPTPPRSDKPHLLPCPWCGPNAKRKPRFHKGKGVKCHDCGAWGPAFGHSHVTEWNTRAMDPEECSSCSPKPEVWDDITDIEKGAMLLAKLEGKMIEAYTENTWVECPNPLWCGDIPYRIQS